MPPKGEGDAQPVRLESLAPQQLAELRANLNNEIQRLADGGNALTRAATTCNNARKAVEQLAASKKGQSIMLPLTSSLYVSGAVDDVEKVLVDIGTGYYVEMPVADAAKFYERRIKTLQDNISNIQGTLRERQNALMQVQAILQEKMAMAQASGARS
ncbi:Prefoldin subunit 5 [Tetrabaena socialis]|uniref:Prefoldin subunit 5 n=1 Tax=Tetrabaena socialis TaxID=47790 RepID=A0A2J8A187_9CHLO|nr:Prefoldin subunit 5 [Tetrabaena socialis]|eukprot:PNH06280.1 Prefoldin subunit 5 [Tetrabaena socialis]